MKLIKFVNAADQFKGEPIYINLDQISAVYEFPKETTGSLTTGIFGGPTGLVWEVEESLETVVDMINNRG